MTNPKMSWDMNINTLLSIASFIVLMGTGAMAYASFEAKAEAWQAEATRRFEILESQTQANTAAIQSGQVPCAVSDERLANILTYVQRIDQKLTSQEEALKRKPLVGPDLYAACILVAGAAHLRRQGQLWQRHPHANKPGGR
jgi:hypothetical protein